MIEGERFAFGADEAAPVRLPTFAISRKGASFRTSRPARSSLGYLPAR